MSQGIIDELLANAAQYCQNKPELRFQVAKLIRTTGDKLSTEMTVRMIDGSGLERKCLCNIKMWELYEGVAVMNVINESSHDLVKLERIYGRLGEMVYQVSRFMMTQCHLVGELSHCRRNFNWQLMTSLEHLRKTVEHLYPSREHERRQMVEKCLDQFEAIKPQLDKMSQIVLHGDFSFRNILARGVDDERFCVIDFQDVQVGPAVVELAIMIVYAVLDMQQVELAKGLSLIPGWIFGGYRRASAKQMDSEELDSYMDYLAPLMKARLCMSLMNGQLAFQKEPGNSYVMHTNQRGWQLLELLLGQDDIGRALFL